MPDAIMSRPARPISFSAPCDKKRAEGRAEPGRAGAARQATPATPHGKERRAGRRDESLRAEGAHRVVGQHELAQQGVDGAVDAHVERPGREQQQEVLVGEQAAQRRPELVHLPLVLAVAL